MPNKSKRTEKVTALSYSKRLALTPEAPHPAQSPRSSPAPQLSHAGLCHLVMIYLPRVLSCPGISTRTCNGYVAGRGHVYTAQHRALSEIPIWLGGSQYTYVEQQSSLQKHKPEFSGHIQAQKWISSAQHCTYTAHIFQPSRIRASKEICVLISAVQGWHSPQRWLCCLLLLVAKPALPSASSVQQMQEYYLLFPPLVLTEHWLQPRWPLSENTYHTIYALNCWHTLSNNGFTSCLVDVWSPNLIYKSRLFATAFI